MLTKNLFSYIRKKVFLSFFFFFIFHSSSFAYIKELSAPDSITDFPIRTTQVGSTAVECYTGSNHSLEWVVHQYGNEPQYSLCLDTNNQPFDQECAGADWAKEAFTMRTCWWSNLKKFHITTNANNFPNHGCRTNPNEPGGFGPQLMFSISHRPDWPNPKYYLGNLDKLILIVDYSTDYFTHFGGCQPPCDPVTNSCQPIAFTNLNLITSSHYL
ncbi:MAG: hypothetical protein NC935_07100 [Candidatus Omnitrophica bacterium]|nr:hypothetical protein [Candidatus Omnitrophota bacterium]